MTKKPFQHVKDLVKDFDKAMLITQKQQGKIHVRPMQIAETTDEGVLRFATSLRSAKIREISDDNRVNLVFQNSSQFLVMSGEAKIETNVN